MGPKVVAALASLGTENIYNFKGRLFEGPHGWLWIRALVAL
jgi:hypothetical protein